MPQPGPALVRQHPPTTAVLSHIVIDEIRTPGVAPRQAVGGAGAYAAVGSSLVAGAAATLLVSGVGSLDHAALVRWCVDRSIDPAGLFVRSEHSPRTLIDYDATGERTETPRFGLDHFDALTPRPRHLPTGAEPAAVYLFHDHDSAYWADVAAYRADSRACLLWELSADSCEPERLPDVRRLAELVDVVSLNRTEACRLLAASSIADAVAALGALGPTVLLRLGADGSIVITGGTAHHVGVASSAVIDPTGGGNAYSGAFLTAYVDSGDPVRAARWASAAAARVIAQVGAPLVDAAIRDEVARVADAIPTSAS